MDKCGFSETECKIILAQIERRAKYRKEFLKMRTDPCRHSHGIGGYVFDSALQRWISMKTCQLDQFKANPKSAMFGAVIIFPMIVYGYAVYKQRTKFEDDCRSGRIRYADRRAKLT